MPPRNPLTPEQATAAAMPTNQLLVVAAPGCGKTTIAAERFGFRRFGGGSDRRRCLAVSFTRAATIELRSRIRERWGPTSLAWPHRAVTLDALHVELLQSLLRSGALRWPNDHTKLTVEDSWRGQDGARRVTQGQWAATPRLNNGVVQVHSAQHQGLPITRIGAVVPLRAHFDAGRCTHFEVRELLRSAIAQPGPRAALQDALSRSTRAIVVDEVFDANPVDLAVVRLALDSGLDVSVIGDPWQAVYEFRGADPTATLSQLHADGFHELAVLTSFRFRTESMLAQTSALRDGAPCPLAAGPIVQCDVVLASEWDTLWDCDDRVLPLSVGVVENQTDAALLVLLDHLVEQRLSRRAVYVDDARAHLRLGEIVTPEALRAACAEFVEVLRAAGADAGSHLPDWRNRLRLLGAPVQLRQLNGAAETRRRTRLQAIANRLAAPASVPGMTVHQAKGGQWPNVGLRVSDTEANWFAGGLDSSNERHRVLYVAATRAQDNVWVV